MSTTYHKLKPGIYAVLEPNHKYMPGGRKVIRGYMASIGWGKNKHEVEYGKDFVGLFKTKKSALTFIKKDVGY